MRKQGKFVLAAALLLVVPSFALAQRAPGLSASASRAGSSAPVVAQPTSSGFRSASVQMHTGNRIVTHPKRTTGSSAGSNSVSSGGSSVGSSNAGFAGDPISLQQLLEPFPAYGFDFEHLYAIDRDLDAKAFIDPATQVRIAEAERRLRHSARAGAGSGFYVLDGGGAYAIPDDSSVDMNPDPEEQGGPSQSAGDQGAQTQPPQGTQRAQQPIIIIQQPTGESKSAIESSDEDAAPLRDVGQFTLVTRGGMEIQAVAFTRVKDKIVYITSEGSRYTMALHDLDSDETVRVNQERGTPLQLPL